MVERISRREMLKLSGAALGGLALGGCSASAGDAPPIPADFDELNPPFPLTQRNTLFANLAPMNPIEPVGANEMRIAFMGTTVVQRRTQFCSSVYAELGNGESFVFDCGAGVTVNYTATQIPMSKMRKVFLTHLHGDHTSDLTHLYCFGPQQDGKSPLYVFGHSASGIEDPQIPGKYYDDGTLNFCRHFREMNRWHTESQSFVPTRWKVGAEDGDGYDIIATELDWRTGGRRTWTSADPYPEGAPVFRPSGWVAYEKNGVRISFFPAVHDRNGSISYKLEWLDKGLSMIFAGDTKPNQFMLDNATSGSTGVDVLIHEMVVPPEVWVVKNGGSVDDVAAMNLARSIQENSHTPEKAFGYLMNEIAKRGKAPRLAVATHFQAEDDTIIKAMERIRSWYAGPVTVAADFMVLKVTRDSIDQRRAVVSDYSWDPPSAYPYASQGTYPPKYADTSSCNPYKPMAPLAQFDPSLLDKVVDPCLYDASDFGCTNPYPYPCGVGKKSAT